MPRKPEDPRPSRRYDPAAAPFPLDRLKSGSAIVAPPGFGGFPFSLAALFARPDAGPPAHSFQVMTQHPAASDHGAGADVGQPGSPFVPGGGGGAGGSRGQRSPPTSTPTPRIATTAPSTDTGPFLSHTDTDTSGSGGGALPGRGGSGGPSGGARSSAANAQPVSRPGGASSFFGASVGGAAGGDLLGRAGQSPPAGRGRGWGHPDTDGPARDRLPGPNLNHARPDRLDTFVPRIIRPVGTVLGRPRRPSDGPKLRPSKSLDHVRRRNPRRPARPGNRPMATARPRHPSRASRLPR